MIAGIDEAGRGAVIGPMVIACVLVENENKLVELGVKDSKLLSPEKREELYKKILKVVNDYVVIKIPAQEIDEMRKRYSLNVIEALKMAEIINVLKPEKVFVDCPQANTIKFTEILRSMLKYQVKIIAENFADAKYPVVAAASIIAKVERDREIEKLKKEFNFDFGVGYPHDERTINFLKKFKELPNCVRKSWSTTLEIENQKKQKKLEDF
ncbi:MAG TPA: ribonuclease HII [Nanoarchaeota archaeon]|nr:ribonuclease HII [Nanoarchaeota archaeon]